MTATKKPPKNRDFLGLVKDYNGQLYWDICFWATKEYGVEKAGYVDRNLDPVTEFIKWQELPPID